MVLDCVLLEPATHRHSSAVSVIVTLTLTQLIQFHTLKLGLDSTHSALDLIRFTR